jgi:hypothetical protein
MDILATETFINWCDEMIIAKESASDTFMTQIQATNIDQSKIEKIKKIYGVSNLPELIEKILSNDQHHCINNTRFLSFSEITDAKKDLNVDFAGKGILPIADCGDNDFIVYHFKDHKWSKFNIVDEVVFKKGKSFKELISSGVANESLGNDSLPNKAEVNVKSEYKNGDIIPIKFFGKPMQVKVHLKERDVNSELIKMFNGVLKKVCNSKELWSYLYSTSKSWIEDVNDDPYFKGKTCKSTKDLIDAVEKINYIGISQNAIWVCGEYWIDPEHGFSIAFPNGKFVRSASDKSPSYDSKYNVTSTGLGQYGDAF